MTNNPDLPCRRNTRLRIYDYTQPGAYFVTICTRNQACLFGQVADGEMRLNSTGDIVRAAWDDLPRHYPMILNDAFVIMPNHIHGIIMIIGAGDAVRAGLKPAPTKSVRTSNPNPLTPNLW